MDLTLLVLEARALLEKRKLYKVGQRHRRKDGTEFIKTKDGWRRVAENPRGEKSTDADWTPGVPAPLPDGAGGYSNPNSPQSTTPYGAVVQKVTSGGSGSRSGTLTPKEARQKATADRKAEVQYKLAAKNRPRSKLFQARHRKQKLKAGANKRWVSRT